MPPDLADTREPIGLELWMQDAEPDHPLHQPGLWPPFVKALDRILSRLDAACPLRIGQKRSAFRKVKTFDQIFEQRAELLAASLLAGAGVHFEFARDHPDLLLGGESCGIEIGTRALDDPWKIHNLLELRLAGTTDIHITLTFDGRPLKLGAQRVEDIVDEIATGSYDAPRANLRFDDAGLTVSVMSHTGILDSQVTVNFGARSGSALGPHMSEVEREIDNKISEKRRQAGTVPTMLFLDFSRAGWGWIRPGHVWLPILRSKIQGTPFVGLALMMSTLDQPLPMQLHAVLDPDRAPSELDEATDRLAEWYGLEVQR